ncbi:protein-glutamine gamma-glutamyltransferase [Oceanobacillus piezotolerans]|uniref:Protein-glutamine gamma-glutamyltransferase n=1 Tax=Oceanobacillus piezotolerans TaxID=2448030 RepID=A0A498D4N9_9BACI|nr:protein-glutamine gamma-glutamyltransferase [Oceanobacillus piezotolerans]RLL43806.1 protein-glutamine gamma-glutamyltransferase [Oceanobacillus piezotolerans]
MIQVSGKNFQQSDMWPPDTMESIFIQRMQEDPAVYSYQSLDQLSFEIKLRKNIILSAKAMNQGKAQFDIFENSRCNPQYWLLTDIGGFQLKPGVKPSDAIRDIFINSSQYAFECATAMVIIYYHAVLNSIDEAVFNHLFQNLYLYSWHSHAILGTRNHRTSHFLPGDVVYFNNPDFDPETAWWRGENAVVLEDGTYFGHGFGIRTAEEMIQVLNDVRRPGSHRSAYLENFVTRPSFKHLWEYSRVSRSYLTHKIQPIIIHHNEDSISHNRYLFYVYQVYKQLNGI